MIKILSWNIQQGGGSRVQAIIQKLLGSSAHIIVLSEYRNNNHGSTIRTRLIDAGYRYQAVSHASREENSVLIVSKLPCNSKLYHDRDMEYNGNLVQLDFGSFGLIGVYLPHKKKHKLFDVLVDEAQKTQPLIIAGDFNTGKNGIDQVGDSFWYTDEMLQLEKFGMVDAFRHVHGQAKEYSWYSHQGNGYRYDHTYISRSVLAIVKECSYLHTWREEKLSDHSPMLLTIV